MLSSIASFLPSALHLNNSSTSEHLHRPTINPDTDDEGDLDDEVLRDNAPRSYAVQQSDSTTELNGQQQSVKGGGKSANETFIFVRPPPSKSNHPLNLQVQLVPPNTKPPTGVSVQQDATTPTSARSRSASDGGASLARTDSRRSQNSLSTDTTTASTSTTPTTSNGSTSSFASTASFSSNAGRRTIIPLYNLQAHNVMTNVIVDAGTDAKIARFQKRGIEMIDVAVLEPIEVWGDKDRGGDKEKGRRRESLRLSIDDAASKPRKRNSLLRPGGSTTSSRASLSMHSTSYSSLRVASPTPIPGALSNQQQQQPPRILDSTTPTPMPPPPPPAPPQKKNIFNKLFNKRSSFLPPAPASSGSQQDPDPFFGAFSLHPAPVVKMKDLGNRVRGKAPPPSTLPLASPPMSPMSQQTTPTQPQPHPHFADESPVSPTPTVAPPKGHGRNSSLTVPFINNPFKIKNRLSAVAGGSGGGGGEKDENVPGKRDEAGRQNELIAKRDASPARGNFNLRESRSHLSLAAESYGSGVPLVLTQSQAREELTNLKQQQLALRPPVLGIQPTFVSPAVLPQQLNPLSSVTSPLVAALSPRMSDSMQENLLVGQRALMYVWLVGKWLKKKPAGEGGDTGLFGGLNLNLRVNNAPGAVYGGVEVRFEWKRAKAKGARKLRKARTSTDDESGVKEEKKRNRMSTASFSTTTASEEGGGVKHGAGATDDGEESDAEDSETPWVCTLKIRRMASGIIDVMSPPSTAFSDAGFPRITPQILKLKVGTLSPTPHHPKVVAMLKVPFPLPDVEVERLGVVHRKGFEEEGREPYYGVTLTAEEIKDVVCSTGLWLVVREGFGGVGRVSRKGDGWRIRA